MTPLTFLFLDSLGLGGAVFLKDNAVFLFWLEVLGVLGVGKCFSFFYIEAFSLRGISAIDIGSHV